MCSTCKPFSHWRLTFPSVLQIHSDQLLLRRAPYGEEERADEAGAEACEESPQSRFWERKTKRNLWGTRTYWPQPLKMVEHSENVEEKDWKRYALLFKLYIVVMQICHLISRNFRRVITNQECKRWLIIIIQIKSENVETENNNQWRGWF